MHSKLCVIKDQSTYCSNIFSFFFLRMHSKLHIKKSKSTYCSNINELTMFEESPKITCKKRSMHLIPIVQIFLIRQFFKNELKITRNKRSNYLSTYHSNIFKLAIFRRIRSEKS